MTIIATACRVCGVEFEPDHTAIVAGRWRTCPDCLAKAAHRRENQPATAKALVDAKIRDGQARDPQRSFADALSDVYGAHPELDELVRHGSYANSR